MRFYPDSNRKICGNSQPPNPVERRVQIIPANRETAHITREGFQLATEGELFHIFESLITSDLAVLQQVAYQAQLATRVYTSHLSSYKLERPAPSLVVDNKVIAVKCGLSIESQQRSVDCRQLIGQLNGL
jgi:hypothetical protein